VLNSATEVIAENQESLHKAIDNLATFSAALARNSDNVDQIMNNSREATASILKLSDNLDKRTDDITIGINKMTATATRQIEIVGKAVTDLAHNPQRILFGGSTSATTVTPAARPAPATTPRRNTPQ
jgi:phospholipid/cholesterol/gamma-HCH transport system substrate-binding protein